MSHKIIFVVFHNFQLLDLSGPIAAFEMANRIIPKTYEQTLVSQYGGAIESSSGITVLTTPFISLQQEEAIDTVVIVGGEGVISAAAKSEVKAFIVRLEKVARRVASICSGAYLLAAAGLLKGRHVTTHWGRSIDFKKRYPEVNLDADRIYVKDDHIWTSAGISAGIDLTLALITEDLGEKIARQVAHQLVVYYQRPGGQSQYSELLEMAVGNGQFSDLFNYIRNNLDKSLMVEDLAHYMSMSPRNFSRCFTSEVGITPAKAVERIRVEAAILALKGDHSSVQVIARQCGFLNIERMRRAFIRLKGIPPSMIKHNFH
ncbi:GlxA family transcriptional regulator [Acinetobacter rudis]|uniref:GlxA family transcriptional regulator n=1 Tax=Acinetobacter rudis TaxID=632955 RepID=UPI003342D9F7